MIRSALLRSSPERAFESLYKRHVKDVYRYCAGMLDAQADAEDATQTTFMNAYRALRRGERPRDSGPWLRSVALNVCREHFRRAGRRPHEVSLDDDPGDLVLDPPGPELGDVVRGLRCLPFNQRAALVMREFEGRSLKEIAQELDVSQSAVEALLFRARRALREQLEERLTCAEAERAISRQLDGALPRAERGPLRAHLRECQDCAALARRVRAQRSAVRSALVLLPLPASLRLGKFAVPGAAPASAAAASGTGGPLLAGSLAAKIAAVTLAGTAAIGLGFKAFTRHHAPAIRPAAAVVRHAPVLSASVVSRTVPPQPGLKAVHQRPTTRAAKARTARRPSSRSEHHAARTGHSSATARRGRKTTPTRATKSSTGSARSSHAVGHVRGRSVAKQNSGRTKRSNPSSRAPGQQKAHHSNNA